MTEKYLCENSWIEISESAYAHNLSFFREMIGGKPELSAVVKANAYGHGWQPVAELAAQHGADSFCVHSLSEALKLRQAGFKQDILIMGPVAPDCLSAVITNNIRLVVFNVETLRRLNDAAAAHSEVVKIHLKLETGTYRQGIPQEKLNHLLGELVKMPRMNLEAVYTHFANIEDTTNHDYAEQQRRRFDEMYQMIREAGFQNVKRHAACTAAAMLFKDMHFDMIRLGIGQYGFWPSRETLVSYNMMRGKDDRKELRPALTWKTRVTQLKSVPAETTIGYGRTYKTTREAQIAVLPAGSSDGYDRGLSGQGYVLIRGKQAPVRGRVCMNLMMVDVTDIAGVELYDEAILIGKQAGEEVSADQIAAMCGTINYEIISRINRDIPRVTVP